MTYLYSAAFYMAITPLLASARKPPCYLWSYSISLTAICQSSTAYDSSMGMNLTSQAPKMSLRWSICVQHCQFSHNKGQEIAAAECFDPDGLLLNQNIDAITAILSAGAPQIYSLFCFSPPCLFNQLRLNHNPYPFPNPPPLHPCSPSQHRCSSLRYCVPTSSMCNDLARLRQTLYPPVFTERQGHRRHVILTEITHFTEQMDARHFLRHAHTNTHRIRSGARREM